MPRGSAPTTFETLQFYQTETVQTMELGTLAYGARSKMFRYVKAGASDLVMGNLLQGPARDTNFTDMSVQAAVTTSVAFNPSFGGYPIPVTLGGSATTAKQFQGGSLHLTSGATILGQTFEIVGNDVQATTTGTCNFYTVEQPLVALTTSCKATANLDPYNGVIQAPTTYTGLIVGVAVTVIKANTFGWIQTHGPCSVLSDSTVGAIGLSVQRSPNTAGCVTLSIDGATVSTPVGQPMVLGVSAETQPVFLTID